nr:unnamed protein product [Digitaria exilis]
MPKMTQLQSHLQWMVHTSTAQQDGDGSSSRQDGDETARIQPAVDRDQTTLPLQEDRHHSTSTQGQTDPPQATQKNRTWSSWLGFSKKSKPCASAHNEGVDIPAAAEIGKLTALHTLGVINVNGAGGNKAILKKELNELTQLRKLGVSGINRGNIKDLFSAISGLHHLESLSLRLDEDNFPDGISLPKPVADTLKSFKLYGNMRRLPASWIEQLGNLENLKLELTISGQEDIGALSDLRFHKTEVITRLCVKLSQGGKLDLGFVWVFSLYSSLAVFEIDCISSSEITFGYSMMAHVELLKVRCWKEASLTFSGLEQLRSLKEVWLMGSFDDDTLKQEMQKQLAVHENKPVLKLLKQCSS